MKRVGIILRESDKYYLNKELVDLIISYNVIPIGIVGTDLNILKSSLDIVDGIILQGGNYYLESELEFIRYLYEKDIPTLGICLGMQMIALALNGSLDTLNSDNHNSKKKYVHEIFIDKNSKLYEILGKDRILVNSRHNDYVVSTKLDIAAYSHDFIIESIEDKSKRFFMGLEWHPESINDSNTKKIFDNFINQL